MGRRSLTRIVLAASSICRDDLAPNDRLDDPHVLFPGDSDESYIYGKFLDRVQSNHLLIMEILIYDGITP